MTYPIPEQLWHYSCEHSYREILRTNALITAQEVVNSRVKAGLAPFANAGPGGVLVWLTDLERPFAKALGLDRLAINCDRTVHRWQVDMDSAPEIHHYFDIRKSLPEEYVWELELHDGAQPGNWYVAVEHVPVTYAPLKGTP